MRGTAAAAVLPTQCSLRAALYEYGQRIWAQQGARAGQGVRRQEERMWCRAIVQERARREVCRVAEDQGAHGCCMLGVALGGDKPRLAGGAESGVAVDSNVRRRAVSRTVIVRRVVVVLQRGRSRSQVVFGLAGLGCYFRRSLNTLPLPQLKLSAYLCLSAIAHHHLKERALQERGRGSALCAADCILDARQRLRGLLCLELLRLGLTVRYSKASSVCRYLKIGTAGNWS